MVGGLDQTDVSLVQQVLEGEAHVLVFTGDLHDEAEVGLDQVVVRAVLARLFHLDGYVVFLLLCQEGELADFL